MLRFAFPIVVLWALPAGASPPVQLEGSFVQGGLVHGQTVAGSAVRFAGHELQVDPEGRFVLGFGRDAEGSEELTVRFPDGGEATRRLEIAPRDYDIERVDGLPPRQVTPSEADLVRIEADAGLIEAAKARASAAPAVAQAFVWPVTGRVSGIYGSQRILNGEPRQPHRGVDVAAPPGTPVRAMADGVISLAVADMYFTGGTVMIDHGYGLHSIYAHLSEVAVAVGQKVGRGEAIGRVGATGRVTGPHLHWGVFWFERALDPALLAGPMPRD